MVFKFKPGDKIRSPHNDTIVTITSLGANFYRVSTSSSKNLRWDTSVVDSQFMLESVYNSELYQLLNKDNTNGKEN